MKQLKSESTSDLIIKKWANDLGISGDNQTLSVSLKPRSHKMAHSSATGEGLVTNGYLGVDTIQLDAGEKFAPHTHPGDHLLIIIGGKGTITYDGKIYPTQPGDIYMVEGKIPHAVGAITNHVILAVGAPHKSVDAPDRMKLVEYADVVSKVGNVYCLICQTKAEYPQMLHEVGCKHCPCDKC